MADAPTPPPTLSEQYHLKETDDKPTVSKPVEGKEVENSGKAGSGVALEAEKVEEAPVTAKESIEPASATANDSVELKSADENSVEAKSAGEKNVEESPVSTAESAVSAEDSPINAEESSESVAESSIDSEETPEIKLETAPADFRFPTTNQTRHCFTRYIEYHRCVAAKGEGAQECEKFAKYYRSLCPGEWVERWNEQRENGTFPGPL